MSEISFNSIFDGVTLALHAAFPAPARIYGDEVKQDLKPGDFNVVMPGAGHNLELTRRYKRTPTLDVIYYPKHGKAECYDVADRLTTVLESITTPEGDVVHATSCEWTVTGGVLHVLVGYDHFVYKPREEIMMETLEIDQRG